MRMQPLRPPSRRRQRLPRRPWIVGALVMWWEYVWNLVTRKPRYPDVEFRRFVRRYQWSCMLRGKRRATELLGARAT